MEPLLSIRQAAEYLNLSYNTVFNHRLEWGFFKMQGSRVWRIHKSDLDFMKKQENNNDRLALSVEEVKLCRSTKDNKMARGGLISQRQVVKELGNLLEQL